MSGFIKLHRSLSEWEWYSDDNAVRLLIHLLISVNYKDKKWRGNVIKKGSMVLSWKTLSQGCHMTIQQCRTAMAKLEASGEVTRASTNKYQVVSLVKWEQMQIEEVDSTRKVTIKQQTNNNQITTTKESKESKEETTQPDFDKNEKLLKQIVNDLNGNSSWIDLVYMKYKLKNKNLGFLLEEYNKHLLSRHEVKSGMKEYKTHFINWMNTMEGLGKLDNYKR